MTKNKEVLPMKRKQWKKIGTLILFLALAAFALSGCSGSDGSAGATGAQGPAGPAGPAGPQGPAGQVVVNAANLSAAELSALTLKGGITDVTIASAPVVKFFITDANGNGITGLGGKNTAAIPSLNNLRFAIAKLVPGVNGSPDKWVSYIVTSTATPPVATRPTTDTTGTIVDHGDGTYTYTFARDLATIKDTAGVTDVTYEPTLTHRLVIQVSGTVAGTPAALGNELNLFKDWVPATGAAPTTQREITTTAACNSCHAAIGDTTPHGGRVDTRYCVVCHTDQRKIGRTNVASVGGVFAGTANGYVLDGEVLGDMPIMVHKIHMGNNLTKTGTGYNYASSANFNFPLMAYPQDRTNCRKCHTASAAAPQGDNWKNKPSRMACGACHDGIDWATGTGTTVNGATTGHIGGRATSDALCTICHTAVDIDAIYHVTDNATPNNPNVPAGAYNMVYEISTVTANASRQPVVTFRIKSYTGPYSAASVAAATPVTFNNAAATSLLTGFTGGPTFLVSYALPQDGIAAPADYNNLGRPNFQPATVSVDTVRTGVNGTLTGPDANGFYVATLTSAAAAFPVGATLRAVALQGYFTQAAGTNGIAANTARHTPGVVKNVTGDTVRRTAVDSAKCFACHEWFEGHGGNRVYEMQMCLPCHVPGLSSSGRTVRLTDPEGSQNLKDMIHSIHAADKRTNAFRHSRAKSGAATIYDWSDVVFPGILNKCEACHVPGRYGSVPNSALMSTIVITGDPAAIYDPATSQVTSTDTLASYAALRNSGLVNPTDLVITPFSAACVACHDSAAAKAHMTANGGVINKPRSTVTEAEQCVICHGPGRSADVTVAHK
jgi:OmcA/MtrC family decaheme c-type cytochrome